MNYFEFLSKAESEQINEFYESFTKEEWKLPYRHTISKQEMFVMTLIKTGKKDLTKKFLEEECNSASITAKALKQCLNVFEDQEFKQIVFQYCIDSLTNLEHGYKLDIDEYLEALEPFVTPKMVNYIETQLVKSVDSIRNLNSFYLFCEKKRDKFSYMFNKG